jgi:mRNA interferase MazF
MTVFRRGDVVLVAFPFTDLTTTKMRPALVVSSDLFNQGNPDIIVVAITSRISKRVPAAHNLLSSQDQKLAGLPKRSLVKLGKIVTLDKKLIRKKLGRIPYSTLTFLTFELHKLLQ